MTTRADLEARRILVVEDDFLIALTVVDFLSRAGAVVVGPVDRVADALRIIETGREELDGAVLDVDLHGEKSYPIVDRLRERSIRFVLTTGYGPEALDVAYRDFPRCTKPFGHELVTTLAKELAR